MLNFILSPKSLLLAGLTLASLTTVLSDGQSVESTMMASRYHQRQHSASSMTTSRFGSGSQNHSHNYRQHMDRVRPVAPGIQQPQEKIATKPATGVRS